MCVVFLRSTRYLFVYVLHQLPIDATCQSEAIFLRSCFSKIYQIMRGIERNRRDRRGDARRVSFSVQNIKTFNADSVKLVSIRD